MKRIKMLASFFLVLSLVMSICIMPATALDEDSHIEQCEAHDEGIAPIYNGSCGYCSGGVTYYYCLDTYSYYETGTHTKLLSGTCTVQYYENQSFMWCSNCERKSYFSGRHYCAERHSICSYGGDNVYIVCPCDYVWYGNDVP